MHVLLSVFKLAFGTLSGSAGLITDGIDNTADTFSSVLIWFGIKFGKEKAVSFFIVIMMFISVVGVVITGVNKIIHPEPLREGVIAFAVSGVCGMLMLLLSAYQYLVGKRRSNFAIMCQAVDSRNLFLTSILVCIGIIMSNLLVTLQSAWSTRLLYADALVSIIIGLLILKSMLELVRELVKTGDEPANIRHFVRSAQEKMRRKIIYNWLTAQLKDTPLTGKQLEERFIQQFCLKTPKIHELSGIWYSPESSEDLNRYLEQFAKEKKCILREGKYELVT